MERLTTDSPQNNTEVALNLVYVKDGQAWVRNGGPATGYPDVELYDYMRLIIADHGPMSIKTGLTDEELGDALYDALFDGIETKEGLCAMLYTLAWAFAELRQRLAAYEDTGLTPEEIRYCLNGSITAEEAKVRYNEAIKQYDEWFAWKQAESEGRLVVLDDRTALAIAAGARAIRGNKRLVGTTYAYDVFGKNGGPYEISYHEASEILAAIWDAYPLPELSGGDE